VAGARRSGEVPLERLNALLNGIRTGKITKIRVSMSQFEAFLLS
jgi:hypothetical protein